MKPIVFTLFIALTVSSAYAESAVIGSLSIDIPADFKAQESQEIDSLDDLVVYRWRAQDGRIIEVLYYATGPKQDRGSMVPAHEEAIEVAGQKTKLIETEVFFGVTKKALVVHLRYGDSIYIIDSEQMPKEEFKQFLKRIQIIKKEANHHLHGTSALTRRRP